MNINPDNNFYENIITEIKILFVLLFAEFLKIYSKFGKAFISINNGIHDILSIKSNLTKISSEIYISVNKSLNTFIDKYDKYLN